MQVCLVFFFLLSGLILSGRSYATQTGWVGKDRSNFICELFLVSCYNMGVSCEFVCPGLFLEVACSNPMQPKLGG